MQRQMNIMLRGEFPGPHACRQNHLSGLDEGAIVEVHTDDGAVLNGEAIDLSVLENLRTTLTRAFGQREGGIHWVGLSVARQQYPRRRGRGFQCPASADARARDR